MNEQFEVKKEILEVKTIDDLLDRAGELLMNVNPTPEDASNEVHDARLFFIEATKRIKEMVDGEEKSRLLKRIKETETEFFNYSHSIGPR